MRTNLNSAVRHVGWLIPVFGLIALVGPFVPFANVLPATLGAMALLGMSASLILAGRDAWLDRVLGGPDKAYSWHRVAGYVAVAALAGHWALASSVGGGLVPPLADLGETAGMVAGVGIIALSAVAALRIIPHHWWRASHWLMGPLFAVSVFHTFLSAGPLPAMSPPWLVLAVASLSGLRGWWRTIRGPKILEVAHVTAVHRLADALEIEVTSQRTLAPFAPGQFQTIKASALSDEPHPFSIAGGDETTRRFGLRISGDWTADLYYSIEVGDEVVLGPPQGRFQPRPDAKRKAQLWVAGGAGITPFLSVLEKMEPDQTAPITLIYSYRSEAGAIGLKELRAADEVLPQLRLLLIDSGKDGRMSAAHVRDALAALPTSTNLYMCGPDGMKATAEQVFRETGKKGAIRHEEFDFRAAWSVRDFASVGTPVLTFAKETTQYIAGVVFSRIENAIGTTGLFRRFSNRMLP